MDRIKPLTDKALKDVEFLIKATEQNMGFVPNSVKTMAHIPAVMGSFSNLAALLIGNPKKVSVWIGVQLFFKNMFWSLTFLKQKERVPLYLRNLVAYASSKASGCRYCQAHTINEALHNGLAKEKVEQLWDFENSQLFSEKERSAIRFAIAAGSLPNMVENTHFTDLRKYFTDTQIVELGATVALFGFLNRWNDTFATTLEEAPKAVAEQYLKKDGWQIGKHG